jgi:hypothetical protein
VNKHGRSRLSFAALTFAGKSRSLNGTIRHFERAVLAYVRQGEQEGREPVAILESGVSRLRRLADRLETRAATLRAPHP